MQLLCVSITSLLLPTLVALTQIILFSQKLKLLPQIFFSKELKIVDLKKYISFLNENFKINYLIVLTIHMLKLPR